MALEIEIESFDWSDKVIEKLWKHGIEFWEVEEVIFEDTEVAIRSVSDKEHGTRWLAQGQTAGGRKLRIYINPCQSREGFWFVVTAWEEGK